MVLLGPFGLALLENHRQERSAGEEQHQDQVGDEVHEPESDGDGRRLRQVRNDRIEAVRAGTADITVHVPEYLEQQHEDRHLQQHRQAAGQRVEVAFRIDLLHLLLQAHRVVGVLLLDFLHQRLDLLHVVRRLDLPMHQRHEQQTEDDRDDKDCHTPVAAKVVEEIDDVERYIQQCFPHRACVLSSSGHYGTGSYPYGPPGRQRAMRFAVSQKPFRNPCFLKAMMAYWEHVGVNRQQDGK